MIFMHFQNSCTRNCDHHIILIMTGNAHKEFCHKLWLILKGEGIETQSKLMVIDLTITQINYLVLCLFCDMVLPLSYVYWPTVYICGFKLFWLRYLPCFRHSDKSGYGFPKIIHHILVCAHQVELFSNKTLRNI